MWAVYITLCYLHFFLESIPNHDRSLIILFILINGTGMFSRTIKYFRIHWICLRIKKLIWGFPGGAGVGSPPSGAGDAGSCPGPGGTRVPRSGWAREPRLLGLRVWSLCSAAGGAAAVRGPRSAVGSGPRSPRLERPLVQRRGPSTAKDK